MRVLVAAMLNAGGLLLLDALLSGLAIDGLGAAFGLATVLALLNAVVWPLLVRVALPVTVATLGLAALLLDGLVLLVAAEIEPRVELGSLPRCGGERNLVPEAGEVAAFEELVGSHGGMGGEQSQPFVLVGPELSLPAEPVVGAAALHAWLVRWRDAPA